MSDASVVDLAPGETVPAAVETPTDTSVCKCGAGPHATLPGTCVRGHAAPGNQKRRVHGIRAYETKGDSALDVDQQAQRRSFVEEVVRDRGGESELTAVERSRIKRLGELDVVASLIASDLARRGLFTPRGRIRSSIDKWLSVLATFDRYADKVGAERRPKSVQSLADYLTGQLPVMPADTEGR